MNLESFYLFLLDKKYDNQGFMKFIYWRRIFNFHLKEENLTKYYTRKLFFIMMDLGMIKKGDNYTYKLYNPNNLLDIDRDRFFISFD